MTVLYVVYAVLLIANFVLGFLLYWGIQKGNKLLEEHEETNDFNYEILLADIIKDLKAGE